MTAPFKTFAGLGNPHAQTVLSVFRPLRRLKSKTEYMSLADRDQLALEISVPDSWRPGSPSIVMVHGLCGSHTSPYMERIGYRFTQKGARVIRVNLRGCGTGEGLAKYPGHSGRSRDILEVLNHEKQRHPESPISLIGFSLGGNVALKLAGELGQDANRFVVRVIAVCPPVDLRSSALRIGTLSNRLYEWYFVRQLKSYAARQSTRFSDLPTIDLRRPMSLYEFDDLYTAPLSGFTNADHYYRESSSLSFIPRIQIPTHILFANDDPFIDASAVLTTSVPANVHITVTDRGGHMGFIGASLRRWMDDYVLHIAMDQI